MLSHDSLRSLRFAILKVLLIDYVEKKRQHSYDGYNWHRKTAFPKYTIIQYITFPDNGNGGITARASI